MIRADGDVIVPTILRSILINIFKEESFELMTKTGKSVILLYPIECHSST